MCGLYTNRPDRAEMLHPGGLVAEIVSAVTRGCSAAAVRIGRVHVLPFSRDRFARVCRRLLDDAPGLRYVHLARVVAAEVAGARIERVQVQTRDGRIDVRPRVVIDCSGDGVVLGVAGAAHAEAPPDERQLAGFGVRLRGLADVGAATGLEVAQHLAAAVRRSALPDHLRFTTFSPGRTPSEGSLKLAIAAGPPAGRVTRARADARGVLACLAEHHPSFRDARIVSMSPRVEEREGRLCAGHYVLSEDDVLRGRRFPTAVARNAWPIELWQPGVGPRYRYLDDDAPYHEVPREALEHRDLTNLLCAGRCISATRVAMASIRVMGPAMALGEAAGLLAAGRALSRA